MWKFLDSYFTFTRREKNGILVLVFLSVAVLLLPKVYLYFKPATTPDTKQYEAEINAFTSGYNTKTQAAVIATTDTVKQNTTNYFNFDPNKIGVKEWMQLGFSEKQALSIEKYKAHGGRFYKPEDLKKVYVIGEEGYKRIAAFVKIDTAAIANRYSSVKYFNFDPNTIGVEEWMKLGFSEKQARSIEKYKATGAKFRDPEDLKRVYVIGEDGYNRLQPYIKIPG